MSPQERIVDAIIVGAGFAGLRAARDLTDRGLSAVVVEARDRVGGRAWTRSFGQSTTALDFGATWFTDHHARVAAELLRYGQPVRTHRVPSDIRWRTGGTLRHGLPVGPDQWLAFERVLLQVAADAKDPTSDRAALSFDSYFEAIEAPPEVVDFMRGWWSITGGTHPSSGAIVDALAGIRDHGGLLGLLLMLAKSPAEGWSSLAERMARDLDVMLGTTVRAVAAHPDRVEVTSAGGATVTGRAAVIAVPLNVLSDIAFEPELPQRIGDALGSNTGSAVKLWLRVTGVAEGALVAGRGAGIDFLLADRTVGDSTMLVGFGPRQEFGSEIDEVQVKRALNAMYPEAELAEWDLHDWTEDPLAGGTWATAPPGNIGLLDPSRFGPDARLIFAGADFAPEAAGWIEGALASGEQAAMDAHRVVTRDGDVGDPT